MGKLITFLVILFATLVAGCNDGRDFTPKSQTSFAEVERILDQYETRRGEHYPGMGGAVLHELQYHARDYREDKWYPIGDHYSVRFRSSPEGLTFGVARDH